MTTGMGPPESKRKRGDDSGENDASNTKCRCACAQEVARLEAIVARFSSGVNCTVCLELFARPYTLGCGHSFCFQCLQSTLSAGSDSHKCPLCRAAVSVAPARNISLESTVETFAYANPGRANSAASARTRGEGVATETAAGGAAGGGGGGGGVGNVGGGGGVGNVGGVASGSGTTTEDDLAAWKLKTKSSIEAINAVGEKQCWQGCFTPVPTRPKKSFDASDGVFRCPMCHWEMCGSQCEGCGFDQAHDSDDDGGRRAGVGGGGVIDLDDEDDENNDDDDNDDDDDDDDNDDDDDGFVVADDVDVDDDVDDDDDLDGNYDDDDDDDDGFVVDDDDDPY